MFGNFEPCCVYGVLEPAQGRVLEPEWLEGRFGARLRSFERWVARLRADAVVYGAPATWDAASGRAEIDETSRALVGELVELLRAHRGDGNELEIGFHLALLGEFCQEELSEYVPTSRST